MFSLRTAYSKIIIFVGFVLFGLVLGFLSIPFDRRYDQWFHLNIPGNFIYEFLGNHVLASVVAWVVIGAIVTIIFKPKIIAWIMGVYVVLFGLLWLIWEGMHW